MTTQAEFTERVTAAAADLALFYVGMPDEKMKASLHRVRSNLAASLSEPFGPDVADDMAREFVTAVAGRRREIEEVAGAMPRVLN